MVRPDLGVGIDIVLNSKDSKDSFGKNDTYKKVSFLLSLAKGLSELADRSNLSKKPYVHLIINLVRSGKLESLSGSVDLLPPFHYLHHTY